MSGSSYKKITALLLHKTIFLILGVGTHYPQGKEERRKVHRIL